MVIGEKEKGKKRGQGGIHENTVPKIHKGFPSMVGIKKMVNYFGGEGLK